MKPRVLLASSLISLASSCAPPDDQAARTSAMELDDLISELHVDDVSASSPGSASAEIARRLGAGAQLTSEQWERLLFSTGVLRIRSP